MPIIYVGDAHLPTDPKIRVWGEHSMEGTDGAQVVDELSRGRAITYLRRGRTMHFTKQA
ncbi:hypothetical protein [Vulcanisaeta sp. JCM 14467]